MSNRYTVFKRPDADTYGVVDNEIRCDYDVAFDTRGGAEAFIAILLKVDNSRQQKINQAIKAEVYDLLFNRDPFWLKFEVPVMAEVDILNAVRIGIDKGRAE